jgi:hypothetical protein
MLSNIVIKLKINQIKKIMKSYINTKQSIRVLYLLLAFIMLGVSTLSVFPQKAAAGYFTSRKLQMSNSSAAVSATTTYAITFTPVVANADAVIIDFCTTAIIGSTCTAPTGLDVKTGVSYAFSGGTGFNATNYANDATNSNANRSVVLNNIGAKTTLTLAPQTITINNVQNPTSTGTFYASYLLI